ncbi:MAG: chemotaxis protein CheR [Isosphaera sp.]|nr:chemotaxis protein CheR [Isosphaera sp.]
MRGEDADPEGVPTPPTDEPAAERQPPYVVGIGASAGGLEALEKLFEAMPADTGMVFVVIQHLSPDFKSLTDTLLARRTAIPIRQAENGMPVEPDVCYLLPPRKDMILSDGRLLLTDKEPAPTVALPIDRFLRSVAQDVGDRAVAVILSGTGSDGSRGIRDVHAAGGLVIAQAPETAKFDGMPKSAAATGAVDYTLPPEEIPAALLRHAEHPSHRELPGGAAGGPLPAGMDAIFGLLRDACGIDFAAYKPETVGRRIERRLGLLHIPTVEEYADRLVADPAEVNALYRDLLIGVTRFFRDPEAFERLGREVLPRLLSTLGRDDDFRVWVAGCATGEEAYTLGMVVQECLDTLPRSVGVKIFATDAHRASLDVAGAGVYPADSLAAMTPTRRERFFVPKGDAFQVAPDLRKQVVFAQHNVLKDAPFTRLDLIVCRNLLIYFLPPAQKKVLSLFHFGLKTGGALFLGPSEGPGDLADEFDTVNARWKVYRKRRDVRLPTDVRLPVPLAAHAIVPPADRPAGAAAAPPDAPLTAVLDMLLDECLTPGILVNDRRQVVRTFAGASRFLDLRDGWFSADLLDAVRPELRPVLAGALPRALGESVPVTFKGLPVRLPDGDRVIDIRVKPVRARRSADTYALVTLAETGGPAAPAAAREMDLGEASREHVLSLEADLRSAKESLQATIEELETSNEELQATNEELTASNEELQSTNEELHSVNEELYTVNGEYQKKIEELTELTADMENLLASTEVHTVFLDRDLCVRKFTPKVADAFNLLPQDIGRRIDHFTHSIDHPGLLDDLRAVLATAAPVERQVRDRRGHWFLLRVLPYRAAGAVAGVVLTLIDIGRVKEAEADAWRKNEQLAGILRNSPNWVFVKDVGGRYLLADEAFKRLVGCDPVGKTAHDLFPQDVADALTAQDARVLRTGVPDETEVVIPHPDGEHTYLSVMFPVRDEAGAVTGLGGIRTDVTALKRAEREAREAVAQRDRFLAVLSHELRNPLAAVVNATSVLARLDLAAEPARWFGVVERRARHMARLLDDLLDVARIAQNKVEVRRAVFDLGGTVGDVLEEVRRVFDERRVRLSVARPDGPLPVLGDPARLQQVQVNLLTNAAKYTPDGGEVWYALGAEGGEAVVRVRDSGVGMSADLLARAFDLFVQADDTLDRSGGGMGVGLTLVRAIVELHGGRVTANSDGPGKGSEFVVRLPLAAPAAAPVKAPVRAPRPAGARRVLVVEDDPDIRESLRAILALDGHEVVTAGDGPAALAVFDRGPPPDVALVDIGIPGMSGYDLARSIRARTDGPLRLVALTGYGRPGDREAAFAAGFDAHLTKPFHPRDLDTVLGATATAADANGSTSRVG